MGKTRDVRCIKVNFSLEGPEGEYRYSSTLSLTSALGAGGWSTQRSGPFTAWKERRYPYRRLDGPQGRCGLVRKISPPPGRVPRTAQLVAGRHTDYAVRALDLCVQ